MGEIPINKSVGPVKLAKASGEVECEAKADTGAAGDRPTQVSVGTTSSGVSEGGVQGEIASKVLDRYKPVLGGLQPVVKAGGELTTEGGELGMEFALEEGRFEPSLRFSVVRYEAEDREVRFATFESGFGFPTPEFSVSAAGHPFKVKAKFAVKLLFEPDWPAIGQWVAKRFGQQAAVELGLAGGFLLAGVATIAAGLHNMSLGREIAGRADGVQRNVRTFCRSYEAVMKGGDPLGGDAGAEGARAARSRLETATVPRAAMIEQARRRDLYDEAWAIAYPDFRRRAIAAYWDEHWFEAMVYGRDESDGPGIRTFTRVLDAMEH